MSVQDIVKYVRQTPGNTNPSVIASMVESEIRQNSSNSNVNSDWAENDSESPSYIKNRTHYETGWAIEYDGNREDKLSLQINDGMYMTFVSDKTITAEELIESNIEIYNLEDTFTITEEMITNEDLITVALYNEVPLIIIIPSTEIANEFAGEIGLDVKIGTYFIEYEGEITLIPKSLSKRRICKLDEKYLPFTSKDINELNAKIAELENAVKQPVIDTAYYENRTDLETEYNSGYTYKRIELYITCEPYDKDTILKIALLNKYGNEYFWTYMPIPANTTITSKKVKFIAEESICGTGEARCIFGDILDQEERTPTLIREHTRRDFSPLPLTGGVRVKSYTQEFVGGAMTEANLKFHMTFTGARK